MPRFLYPVTCKRGSLLADAPRVSIQKQRLGVTVSSQSTASTLRSQETIKPVQLTPIRAKVSAPRKKLARREANYRSYRFSRLAIAYLLLTMAAWTISQLLSTTAWQTAGVAVTIVLAFNALMFQLSNSFNVWSHNAQQPLTCCPTCLSQHIVRKRRSTVQRIMGRLARIRTKAQKCQQCGWRGLTAA